MTKLEILKDYEEWLENQLETRLDIWDGNYVISGWSSQEVKQEELLEYSQVLATKKELVKTQLEIVKLESKGE